MGKRSQGSDVERSAFVACSRPALREIVAPDAAFLVTYNTNGAPASLPYSIDVYHPLFFAARVDCSQGGCGGPLAVALAAAGGAALLLIAVAAAAAWRRKRVQRAQAALLEVGPG